MPLELYDCLTAEECQKVLSEIYKLKEMWIPRLGAGFPFYTLGIASYLDAANKGQVFYKLQAQKTNPVLWKHFANLYEKLKTALFRATGKEVLYEEAFALPGFHIFQYGDFFNYPVASYHFDLQFKELFWKYRNIDYKHPLSFTLSIKLPRGGAGLNYWDIFFNQQIEEMSNKALDELREQSETRYIGYEVGKMVVHEGLMLHQIAPMKAMVIDDERITLQGHALICDNVLRVYW